MSIFAARGEKPIERGAGLSTESVPPGLLLGTVLDSPRSCGGLYPEGTPEET